MKFKEFIDPSLTESELPSRYFSDLSTTVFEMQKKLLGFKGDMRTRKNNAEVKESDNIIKKLDEFRTTLRNLQMKAGD